MPLSKRDAEKCLNLLWDYLPLSEAEDERRAYGSAISSLHAYLTDVLPASQPCVRARYPDGVVEILLGDHAECERKVDLYLSEGEKLGLVLDRVDVFGEGDAASPIVISLLKPSGAAAKDGRLSRGDQILQVNGYSLAKVSLQRAQWLLDSAERSQKVILTIIASGLVEGLRHSVSRHSLSRITPQMEHRVRSRSIESFNKARVKKLLDSAVKGHTKTDLSKHAEKQVDSLELKPLDQKRRASEPGGHLQPEEAEVSLKKSWSSMRGRPGYAPSVGSIHNSEHSFSSTVEAAARMARSSMRSSLKGDEATPRSSRRVKKLHIMKGNSGLGIHIIGGKGSKYGDGIFIRQLEEGGAAFNHGCLHSGDELLMVDGMSLVGLAHEEAVAVLRGTQKLVQLVIATDFNEGDSVTSSLQSIPDLLSVRSGTGRSHPLFTPHQELSGLAAGMTAVVDPEMVQAAPPLLNTYHQTPTAVELRPLNDSTARRNSLTTGELETDFSTHHSYEEIEIYRSEQNEPLGMNIVECEGCILVKAINPSGLAGQDGRLREGQQLLAVNGISLTSKSKHQAIEVLSQLEGEKVKLQVQDYYGDSDQKRKKVVLHKGQGERLGLQLTPGYRKGSVKVKNIARGSPAHNSSNLSIGDELVLVNGANVSKMGVDIVRNLLSNYPPGDISLEVLAEEDRVEPESEELNEDFIQSTPSTRHSKVSGVKTFQCAHTDSFEVLAAGNLHMEQASSVDSDAAETGSSDSEQTSVRVATLGVGAATPPSLASLPTKDSTSLSSSNSSRSSSKTHEKMQCPVALTEVVYQLKNKARGGLGVAIVTGESYHHKLRSYQSGFFVIRKVITGGIAFKDGRLQVGDQLVAVNGECMIGKSQAEVMQTINEANKEMRLKIWRDPNSLASSSMCSLGSRSNMSGSFSSIETMEESPSCHGRSRRVFTSSSPKDSPLVARYSYAGPNTLPQHDLQFLKRRSTGNTGTSHYDSITVDTGYKDYPRNYESLSTVGTPKELPKTPLQNPSSSPFAYPEAPPTELPKAPPTELPEAPPTELPKAPPTELPEALPTELPEAPPTEFPPEAPPTELPPEAPPIELPPEAPPTELPLEAPPMEAPGAPPTELPPEAPPMELPEAPPTELPEAPPMELPKAPPLELPKAPPMELPKAPSMELLGAPPMELPETSPSELFEVSPQKIKEISTKSLSNSLGAAEVKSEPYTKGRVQHSRPTSLKVPRGKRLEKSPFELEFRKGMLGLSIKFERNAMGMIEVKSLSSRSVLAKDNNVRVGDILLAINDDSTMDWTAAKAESTMKSLPRGDFRLTVMAPPQDVTGCGLTLPAPEAATSDILPLSPGEMVPELSETQYHSNVTSDVHSKSAVTSSEHHDEGVLEVTLECTKNQHLGFVLEGGVGSKLNMIHIQSLLSGSPACECGEFRVGDEIVIVGQECLVGKTLEEANSIIKAAPSKVVVVAQRKVSPKLKQAAAQVSPDQVPSISKNDKELAKVTQRMCLTVSSSTEKLSSDNEPAPQTPAASTITCPQPKSNGNFDKGAMTKFGSEGQLNLSPPDSAAAEETLCVRLQRGVGEKYGLKVAGGRDHPSLKNVHVKQILSDGVAHHEGSIRRGDHLVMVNERPVDGLTNREAVQLLREAGNDMTLILTRKIGRRISRQTTPSSSREVSRAESRCLSPQRSPPRSGKRGFYSGSSDEGSCEGSRGPSPSTSRRHRRRESVTIEGEVVNLRDKRSTLPRKLHGARVGVRLVELHKGPTGLGMQVSGGHNGPITVKVVLKGGPADKSHSIHVGDEILEVNKTSFEKYTQKQAMEFIKALPQGKVSIILRDRQIVHS